MGGKPGQEPCPEANRKVLALHDTVLAERDDLLGDGDHVSFLIDRKDIGAHDIDIGLATLHEMGLNGTALEGTSVHSDDGRFAFVHERFGHAGPSVTQFGKFC